MATPRKDLKGQKFGYLTVLECTERRAVRPCGAVSGYIWKCQCECGKIIEVEGSRLTSGKKQSCGCKHYNIVSNKLRKGDITGKKFGRLTVIKWLPLEKRDPKHLHDSYLCKCDCGNYIQTRANQLETGNKKSCGCYHEEYSHSRKVTHQTHNASYTRLYKVWMVIKDRCTNPNNKSHARYYDRGIRLCDEWFDFEVFREWALKNGFDENAPQGKCTIERVDNNKGYSPDNCIWADAKVQRRNQEKCKYYEYNGERHILTDWAKILGVSYGVLSYALHRKGMTIEEFKTTYKPRKKRT